MADGLADLIASNPKAAWRALDCADARDSLHDFCGMIDIPGAPVDDDKDLEGVAFSPIETPQASHHKLLLDRLEAVERGDIKRLMVFMPPGSSKSTYASVVFPAWFMGKKPRRNVIVATYAADLGRKIGRRMRSVVKQPTYQEIFKTSLADDQKAADEWALDNGGEFMSGGILSGITGNRADGLIIDDPVKGRQDADSETIQTRTKDEFDDSLKTRLKPRGWIVLIQTRWNENDLAGQILPESWDGESGPIMCRDGQVWEVLCIPAQAEENDPLGRKPGEMLWPEWFDDDHWATYRSNQRTWSALYQQRPSPADGTFFQRQWFRRYRPGDEPRNLRKYITSDHAPTDGEDSDPNVARVWGVDTLNDLYLLDGFNRVQKMDKTADAIIGLIKKHKPFAWFPEDDNNYKSAEPFILLRMKQEGVRTRIEPMSPHGQDKASKAQSFQGMAAMGAVWVPEGPEGDAIIDEFVKFPAGRHDEEVDVAAIMGRAIAMAHPAIVPPEDAPPPGEPQGIGQMTWDQLMAQQQPKRDRV